VLAISRAVVITCKLILKGTKNIVGVSVSISYRTTDALQRSRGGSIM